MTPPETGTVATAATGDGFAAVSACPQTMRKRADFLRAAQGRRHGTPGFLLQARRREDGTDMVRIGFTCSKKVGNAVLRNRAKRRLRAIARAILPGAARPGWDYVLVGRPEETVARDFALLLTDLTGALARVHAEKRPG